MSHSLSNTEAEIKLNGWLENKLKVSDNIGIFVRSGPAAELHGITTQLDETSR